MDRLFCAIDTGDADSACALVERLHGAIGGVKLGAAFVMENGLTSVGTIVRLGLPVWLDLKLLEIPREVAQVVRAASESGAVLVTVHALGGASMMRAAMAAALGAADAGGRERLNILAVPLPIDADDEDVGALGMSGPVSDQVCRLADLAHGCGVDGAWVSADDLALLRARFGSDFMLVVSGVRPSGPRATTGRTSSRPATRCGRGADYLVVGRPITQADDPRDAATRIAEEMAAAMS